MVKSVHIECGWDPSDPVGETEWLQRLADQHGYPHGIVARATLDAPNVEQVLEGHARHKNIRGIRHAINWHPDPAKTYVNRPDLIRTKAWRHGFSLLQRFGLSFDLQLYPAQMADAAALARAYPDILIILDHAGMPVDRDKEGIRTLAARHAGTGGCSQRRGQDFRVGDGGLELDGGKHSSFCPADD